MKVAYFLLFASLLFTSSCGNDVSNTEQKKEEKQVENKDKDAGIYGYESGMVETHFGDTQNKEILYFDKWGTMSAKYTYTENRSTGAVILSSIEIIKNGTTYFIDPVAKTGMKMEIPFGENDMGDAKEVLGFKEERKLKLLGYYNDGTVSIEGKKCSIWKEGAMDELTTTTYIHEGIILKTIIRFTNEETVSEATDIQFNIKIPADKFEIPKGIKF